MGDPRQEDTFIGPIINEDEATRIERTIQQAVGRGATLLCGGRRNGRMVEPAVLEDVPARRRRLVRGNLRPGHACSRRSPISSTRSPP